MGRPREVKLGEDYAGLRVISEPFVPQGEKSSKVRVQCGCGRVKTVLCRNLVRGSTTSCGCRRSTSLSEIAKKRRRIQGLPKVNLADAGTKSGREFRAGGVDDIDEMLSELEHI